MTLLRQVIKIGLVLFVFCGSGSGYAQEFSMDDFCDIEGTSASLRIDKIIRWFKLSHQAVGQLTGRSKCPKGESFVIKTTCIGPYRVAIISLLKTRDEKQPLMATRLFHLYTKINGNDKLTLCQPATSE